MTPIVLGILVNSALYLSGCVAAGLVTGNGLAWRFALAAVGVTYIGYVLQYVAHALANAAVWLSVGLGVAAGLSLLFPAGWLSF